MKRGEPFSRRAALTVMCSRITCPRCRKPSYSGCGAHVEMVLGDVPRAERCKCREQAAPPRGQPDRAEPEPQGLWKRIFG